MAAFMLAMAAVVGLLAWLVPDAEDRFDRCMALAERGGLLEGPARGSGLDLPPERDRPASREPTHPDHHPVDDWRRPDHYSLTDTPAIPFAPFLGRPRDAVVGWAAVEEDVKAGLGALARSRRPAML